MTRYYYYYYYFFVFEKFENMNWVSCKHMNLYMLLIFGCEVCKVVNMKFLATLLSYAKISTSNLICRWVFQILAFDFKIGTTKWRSPCPFHWVRCQPNLLGQVRQHTQHDGISWHEGFGWQIQPFRKKNVQETHFGIYYAYMIISTRLFHIT